MHVLRSLCLLKNKKNYGRITSCTLLLLHHHRTYNTTDKLITVSSAYRSTSPPSRFISQIGLRLRRKQSELFSQGHFKGKMRFLRPSRRRKVHIT